MIFIWYYLIAALCRNLFNLFSKVQDNKSNNWIIKVLGFDYFNDWSQKLEPCGFLLDSVWGDAGDLLLLKLLGVQTIHLDVLSKPPPFAAVAQRALNHVLY